MNDKDSLLKELGELKDSSSSSFDKNFYFKLIIIFSLTIYISIHIGEMLFGINSIDVMNGLKESKKILYREVENIKSQNAKLQKIYFEQLELKPIVKELNLTDEVEDDNRSIITNP